MALGLLVLLWYQKRWNEMKKTLLSLFFGGTGALAIFPYMIKHILGGKRGKDSFRSLFNLGDYSHNLIKYIRMYDKELFGGFLIFMLLFRLLGVLVKRKTLRDCVKTNTNKTIAIFIMTLSVIMFTLLIAKIAPFQTDRYVFCVFPIVYILIMTFLYIIERLFFRKSIMNNIILIIVIFVINLTSFSAFGVEYLYLDHENRQEFVEANRNIPCMFVYEYESCDIYFDYLELKEYASTRYIREDNLDNLNQNGYSNYNELIFVEKNFEPNIVVKKVLDQNKELNHYELIYTSEGSAVYKLTK